MDPPKPKHDHRLLTFPENFLWGTATSAHQVEGNNIHSDWWAWEQKLPKNLRSGLACDHYQRYQADFDLAKKFHHNAHRLSVEWSRIEPEKGKFVEEELEHYQKALKALKDSGITVMLTLWHFTLPKWVADEGGWSNSKTILYFENFVQKIVPHLSKHVDLWVTINEPGVYVYQMAVDPQWPNARKSFLNQMKIYFNLAASHRSAYRLIKKLAPHKPVGIANNIQSFEPSHRHSLREQFSVMVSDLVSNHLFYFLTKNHHDFLGINYYFHSRFKANHGVIPNLVDVTQESRDVSDLGWEIYPEGIFEVLTDLSNHLPIYITECGVASTNDDRRIRFLIHYLQEVYRAIQVGVPVKGFFYWSLIDNFEWQRGFDPRFGLIEVDYKTQKRIPRPSAQVYADIIKHNGIPHHLLRFIGHTVQAEEVLERIKNCEICAKK